MIHDMTGLVPPETKVRRVLRILLAAFYLLVGMMHLRAPAGFLAITPDWVPYPLQVIIFTGVCEIAGAVALVTRRFRAAAGVMLALYAVCVYPANIKQGAQLVVSRPAVGVSTRLHLVGVICRGCNQLARCQTRSIGVAINPVFSHTPLKSR
jgi:uncharacterized membrane protein